MHTILTIYINIPFNTTMIVLSEKIIWYIFVEITGPVLTLLHTVKY